ncbi:DUF998 domain-containing protein [Actinoplanes sp. NPDC051494]|uniref:DUF998 domain-containing protein n=1 Tax=Actinoplanes sp. NPDC051494 TaxID=3363907 RepID=UPI0037AD781C
MTFTGPARSGALCWVAAAPVFLIANVVAGLGWRDPGFSWRTNNISDLGNVTCGVWDTTRPRYVCSPWHGAMNTAMVVTALLLLAVFVLTWRAAGRAGAVRAGQVLMLLWAVGLALVGLFPADTHENMHFLAAVLIFGPGNLGMVVAGFARRGTFLARVRFLSLGLGLLGLAGSVLFLAQQDLGLGLGGMERVAVFALPVWAGAAGVLALTAREPGR